MLGNQTRLCRPPQVLGRAACLWKNKPVGMKNLSFSWLGRGTLNGGDLIHFLFIHSGDTKVTSIYIVVCVWEKEGVGRDKGVAATMLIPLTSQKVWQIIEKYQQKLLLLTVTPSVSLFKCLLLFFSFYFWH